MRSLFLAGLLILFAGIAVGLIQSFRTEHRPPPVELAEVVETYLDDIEGLIEAGEHDRAIDQLELTLSLLHTDRHLPHEKLGRALAQQGRTEEAIEHFRRAVELRPDFTEAHFNLGVAYSRSGRRDEAILALREALRLDPEFAPARANLDRLQGRADRETTAAPGEPPAELLRGRSVAVRFYTADFESLREQFSEELTGRLSIENLQQMHERVREEFGPEQELLDERLGAMVGGRWLYVRRVRFEKPSKPIEMLVQLEPDLSIAGLAFRPAESGRDPE